MMGGTVWHDADGEDNCGSAKDLALNTLEYDTELGRLKVTLADCVMV